MFLGFSPIVFSGFQSFVNGLQHSSKVFSASKLLQGLELLQTPNSKLTILHPLKLLSFAPFDQ